MREKCPHEVQTWPWVFFFFLIWRLHTFLWKIWHHGSSWLPVFTPLGSLSVPNPPQVVPSLSHPPTSNQWPYTIFHMSSLECSFRGGSLDGSIHSNVFLREPRKWLQECSVLGPSFFSSLDSLGFSLPLLSLQTWLLPQALISVMNILLSVYSNKIHILYTNV